MSVFLLEKDEKRISMIVKRGINMKRERKGEDGEDISVIMRDKN